MNPRPVATLAGLKPRRQDDFAPGENHSTASGSAFTVAQRASPTFRNRHKFTELQRFVQSHGVLEKRTVEKEYEVENKGQTTLVTRRCTYVKELPGVSPAPIALFSRRLFLPGNSWPLPPSTR